MKPRLIGQLGEHLLYSDHLEFIGQNKNIWTSNQTHSERPAGTIMFQYGPATGGLIESVGMNIETFGEQIQAISVVPYKTRRISVSVPIEDLLLNIERINGNFTASHVAAFLTAVENAYCVTPPREVILGRVAQIELERIRNHLMTTQRLTEHAGFLVPSAHLLYLVENVNRIIGRAFGHRYFFGVNTLRGFKMDWQLDVNILKTIIDEFQDTFKCILENRVFIDRLQGNGVVTDESSIGPAARAAGYTYDARLDGDLAGVYRELDFNVCKTDLPDAFGRLLIRGREVSESLRILLRILRSVRINSGDSVDWFGDQVNDSKNFTSSGLGRVESPSGDLTYRVDVRDGVISKVHLLSPSEVNLRSFRSSMSGKVFTDLPFNWDSFGIWMAEVGVEFR